MSAPYQPQSVVLQTGNGKNFLLWDIVPGATGYQIQRSLDGITFATAGTSTAPTYLDSSVSVGTSYYYQVAATNVSGTSIYNASYPVNITPCLPGQINLGYLRYLSQLRADKLNSQYLTVDEWNSNINQSMFELGDILATKYGEDYFMAQPLQITLTGTSSIPVPDGSNYPVGGVNSPAMFKLLGIDANAAGASPSTNACWVPLARTNWSDRDRFTAFQGQAASLNNIYQPGYRVMGQSIYIFPPGQTQLIQLWYVPILSQLLQDTDMLVFSFNGWFEYIVNDVAMKAMVKEESLEKWNALAGMNAKILERINTSAPNRDAGQPNTVSNVRATMGDPGFSSWGSGGFGGWGWGGY